MKSEYGVFCITIGSAQLQTGYAMMICALQDKNLQIGAIRPKVKIWLGSHKTLTALFIMILPKDGAEEAGGIQMRH